MPPAKPLAKAPTDLAVYLDRVVRTVLFTIERAIVKESPVGNPSLWKVNLGRSKRNFYRPPGYVGGTFRRSWRAVYFKQAVMGIIANPMPYAVRLAEEGHSSQVPRPWISARIPELLRELSGKIPPYGGGGAP